MTKSLADASDGSLVVAIGRFHEDALAETYRRHGRRGDRAGDLPAPVE
jgi:hypothetical protein